MSSEKCSAADEVGDTDTVVGADHQPLVRLRPKNEGEELRVSETLLRKRNRDLKGAAERQWVRDQAKQNVNRIRKARLIKTAESFVVDAKRKGTDKRRFLRTSRNGLPRLQGPDWCRVLFAVRNTLWGISDEAYEVLKELGLTTIHTGRFIRYDKENLKKLQLVETFVFYGYPTLETIRMLFLRRGCVVDNKLDAGLRPADIDEEDSEDSSGDEGEDAREKRLKRMFGRRRPKMVKKEYAALSDNAIVEAQLGHLGMLCIEDLVAETNSCGPNFDEIMNYIGPFALSSLRKVEGIDWNEHLRGNVGLELNEKLKRIA